MGLLTYGILYPPYDALTLAGEQTDITAVKKGYAFGVVDAVNYANVKVNEGATVLFRQDDAILVTAGGTNYYIVDEKEIIFKRNPLL